MYAKVVVLTYQAPDIDSFTYQVPRELEKEIQIGQLVEVPFGKRTPMGIVVAISNSPLATSQKISNFKFQISNVKKINQIILQTPLLLPYQIELVKWMSTYYLAPMVNCLNAILPELPSAKSLGRHLPLAINHLTLTTKAQSLMPNAQSLILVPSLNKIAETLAKFPKAKNYVAYHSELKASEKFTAWQKILSGNIDYIFGSRSAIFTPCPNLKEIIIYDEHDGAYKDERSPYFDTLTVAQKISQLTGAQIKIVDPSPRITTYHSLKNHIKIQKFKVKTEIVSTQNEKASGNFSTITLDLAEKIKSSKKILLFLNKKKETGTVYCKTCKQSSYATTQPEVCPNCQSADVHFFTLNTNSIKKEVKKQFLKNTNIDIQSASVLYSQLLEKYDLVAFLDTDALLNRVDFTSEEKLYQQITSLKKVLKVDGALIIQTTDPDNAVFKYIKNDDFEAFYNYQNQFRKSLLFPPHAMLVKLTIKGKDSQKTKLEAQSLATELRLQLPVTSYQLPVTILGPYKSIFWRKQTTYSIITKYKLGSYSLENRTKAIKRIAESLPIPSKHWQIVIEPESIN